MNKQLDERRLFYCAMQIVKPHLNYKGGWWCLGRLRVSGPWQSQQDAYMNWSLRP